VVGGIWAAAESAIRIAGHFAGTRRNSPIDIELLTGR
jgi:hypothetical protein